MGKKFYIKSNGVAVDVLTKDVYCKSGETAHLFKEGDFVKSGGVAVPILRFDSIPFGGRVSGANMIFQFGISDKLLTASPTIVCLGSSTMAGQGLSSPNRLQDRLNAWLAANATGATLINYALGGQTMAALRPTASGGTAGRNIDTALADSPTIVLIDEPTNWAASYDVATQVAYMEEIFNYAFARGVLVVFTGSRPRTPYSGTQDARLVDLNAAISTHPYLKYVTCINFGNFLQPSTVADLRTDYDQGDGIHLNAAGVQALADDITAFWQRVFRAVTAFDQYTIEKSADGSTGWSVVQTITDMTLNQLTVAGETGYYRARARLKDGSYIDYSAVTYLEFAPPPEEIEAKFNFNRAAQSVPDWVDVSGVFHTTQIDSATYPGTTIFIRTKPTNASAVNIWGNTAGDSSNNSVGQTTGNNSGAFPDNVLLSNAFTTGQSYAAGNEQIEIRGLEAGASYTIKGMGSRVASAVATPTRLMDWNCVDANGLQTIEDYNVKGNTATLAQFTGRVADATGVIKLAINRPTPTDANFNFGYCNGLTVQKES